MFQIYEETGKNPVRALYHGETHGLGKSEPLKACTLLWPVGTDGPLQFLEPWKQGSLRPGDRVVEFGNAPASAALPGLSRQRRPKRPQLGLEGTLGIRERWGILRVSGMEANAEQDKD